MFRKIATHPQSIALATGLIMSIIPAIIINNASFKHQLELHKLTVFIEQLKIANETAANEFQIANENRRIFSQLDTQDKISLREQKVKIVEILVNHLLNPDSKQRRRAVNLLQVIDPELGINIAKTLKENDESSDVKQIANETINSLVKLQKSKRQKNDEIRKCLDNCLRKELPKCHGRVNCEGNIWGNCSQKCEIN